MYLQNETIRLRALEPEDLDLLYSWENDPELWTISNAVEPYSRYILKEYIAYSDRTIYEKKQLRLMIVVKSTDEVVGSIDIFDFDQHHSRAGIGILIDKKFRSKGYASQALDLVVEYAFKFLHLNQLYAHVTTSNAPSRELFLSHGFVSSGIMRDWIREADDYLDLELFQLIR